jgi:hypothetical protein
MFPSCFETCRVSAPFYYGELPNRDGNTPQRQQQQHRQHFAINVTVRLASSGFDSRFIDIYVFISLALLSEKDD